MARVAWRQADALALPFEDGAFDALACQFGVMFFPDRVAGFREVHRVLKPGGRFLFNLWDELSTNPVMQATVQGLALRYPAHPSWFVERTPCGYRDPPTIRSDLCDVGFADCTIETVIRQGMVASVRDPALGMCQGSPMRAEITRRFGAGPFNTKLQALIVETDKARE